MEGPGAVTREEAAAPAALPETINGAWYRHSKGGVYRLLGEATHTETKEALVVYADQADRLWARPRPMFVDGRFTLMHEGEPADARSLLLAYVEGHIGPPHTPALLDLAREVAEDALRLRDRETELLATLNDERRASAAQARELSEANLRLAEVVEAATAAGWNGVENPKSLAGFIARLEEERQEAVTIMEMEYPPQRPWKGETP